MTKKARSHVEDLRGASRLAVEATQGVTALVEEMHRTIAGGPDLLGRPLELPTKIVTGMVYGGIRGITRLVGAGIDGALEQLAPLLGQSAPGPEREAVLAALNGVLGDYLDETNNPLAIQICLRHDGHTLELDGAALAQTFPAARGKLLVLVHGSCMNDRQWCRSGHDHGAALARDLDFMPVYVHYNSGRHCSTNGLDLAVLLDQLALGWPAPLEEIVVVAHSMGGLVTRSACRAAEMAGKPWRQKLRAVVFLGTPHHGAPLERGGNWVDVLLGVSRFSAPLARLGKIRSAGVTDLRFGNVLDEHWSGRDRFERGEDRRSPLPLPEGVACYAAAGALAGGAAGALGGDGLVPVSSALGVHERADLTLAFPDSQKWIGAGVGHLELLNRPEVYAQVRGWLSAQ
jgi:pimeloyl-ACP methyl ester carboxylesterase